MTSYLELYRALELPAAAISIASGEMELDFAPPRWCGFPPALLPFAWTSSGIVNGYWKHWFVPDRRLTIVEFFGHTMFSRALLAMEVARTLPQWACIRILQQLSCSDELSEESNALAEAACVDDVSRLEELCEERGDDLEALRDHPTFHGDPPQSCFEDLTLYPGDFPRPGIETDSRLLRRACGYEIHSRFGNGLPDPERFRERVAQSALAPPWLRTADQKPVFASLLAIGDLAGAWLSLNSVGWRFTDAREAITQLAERAGNPVFSALASAWISLPHEEAMRERY